MDQPPPIASPAPPTPGVTPTSLTARLFNVLVAPGEVFEEVKNSPPNTGNWLVPMLIFMVLGCVSAVLILSQEPIKQQLREQYRGYLQIQVDKGILPKERLDTVVDTYVAFAPISQVIGAAVIAAIEPFWWGIIIWVIGAKIWKQDFALLKGVEVAGLTLSILILGAIVHTLLAIILSNQFAFLNLALLFKVTDPNNPYFMPLTLAEVLTIWAMIVRSIGLARLGGRSVPRAAVWVFGIWLLEAAVLIALALIGLALKKMAGGSHP